MQNLFQTYKNEWQEHNNIYNPDKQLDYDQVKQMTHNIALANKMVEDTDYILKTFGDYNLSEINSENLGEFFNITKDIFLTKKPIILQIGNCHHWITMGLLPNPQKPQEYFAVKMNSYIPNELKDIRKLEYITDEEKKKLMDEQPEALQKERKEKMVDPDPTKKIIEYLENSKQLKKIYTNLDMQPEQQSLTISSDADEEFFDAVSIKAAIDLSVNQQLEQNCGLMTAANSVSILNTYNELIIKQDNIFDDPKTFENKFKTALEKHVFYEKKQDGKRYVLGKETDLKEGAVVQIIGQAVAEGKCINEEIEEKVNAQLIKSLLLEDAMDYTNDEEKKPLIAAKKGLEDGKLTDAEFNQALTNAGFNLAEYVEKEQRFAENRQDNNHDIASESWSARIHKTVQNGKENLLQIQ